MTIEWPERSMVEGKALRIASLEQEWYEDIEDPKL